MKKTTTTRKSQTSKKHLTKAQKRQHEIGKIFRRLMKQGFDAQTSFWVARQETQEF